jgi:hypothetical protein
LESILGLLKSLKIRAQDSHNNGRGPSRRDGSWKNCGAGITCFPASQSELQVSKISQLKAESGKNGEKGSPASLLANQNSRSVKSSNEKLEAGKIVEQGSPASLLANQNSRSVKSSNEKLEAGKIVEQGSPASLLANHSFRSVKSAS